MGRGWRGDVEGWGGAGVEEELRLSKGGGRGGGMGRLLVCSGPPLLLLGDVKGPGISSDIGVLAAADMGDVGPVLAACAVGGTRNSRRTGLVSCCWL